MDQSFVTERLEATCRTFNALERQLADPSVAADPEQLLTLAKERSRLEPLVLDYQRLQQLDAESNSRPSNCSKRARATLNWRRWPKRSCSN